MLCIRVEAATGLAHLANIRTVEKPVYRFKVDKLPNFFTSSIGDDVEVCVAGTYSAPERDCNWGGNFDISHVWLPSDPKGTDIHSLLTQLQIDRIEREGFEMGGVA